LTSSQRTSYINAVLCLMKKPSKADPAFAPGSQNRYDDFVAVHINQTLTIHGTVRTYQLLPPPPFFFFFSLSFSKKKRKREREAKTIVVLLLISIHRATS
jgi:hypothetical protein